MRKIPTIFERDWDGDRSRVVNVQNSSCGWVFDGLGTATQKLDGTSCLVRDGKLYKRREIKSGQPAPADFEVADVDLETGKTVGWVPVGDGAEDRWHREAWKISWYEDGTYELLGPKVQGNPERKAFHALWRHDEAPFFNDAPRTFDSLKEWLADKDIEGLVWHHPDGRMAKIKKRDFGLKR